MLNTRTLPRGTHSRRGSALALSLVAIATICAIGVGIVQLQVSLERRQSSAADRRRALYVAEAGLSEATLAVSQGRSGAIATEGVPALLGDGIYWVESEELVGGRILLTSHAAAGTQRFSLQAMVLPNVSPVGEFGFFGGEGVTIGWGAILDGYDSSEGSYASQIDPTLPFPSTGEGVEVYSNGDIAVADESAVAAEPESAGGEGSVATPLWDTITSVTVDPFGAFALSAAPSGEAPTTTVDGTLAESMAVLADAVSTTSEQLASELGLTEFRVIVEGVESEITSHEYVYLLQRTMNGATVSEIEAAFVDAVALQSGRSEFESLEGAATTDTLLFDGSSDPAAAPDGSAESLEDPGGTGTYVYGTAVPGEESYVATGGNAHISETGSPLRENLVMPRVVVPRGLETATGTRTVAAGVVDTITERDVWIDGIVVETGGTLVLRGPLSLAVATLDVAELGTVVFSDQEGPVRLYVTDRLAFAEGSLVESPVPHESAFGNHVLIGGRPGSEPGSRVELLAIGEYHGVLYAPEDDVTVPASLRYYGAIAARHLAIAEDAHLSYDRSFATDGTGLPSLPKILSWQVVAIEEGELKSLRFNPVMALRMRGITPIPSAIAALETDFEVTYFDHEGRLKSYAGSAAGFDWSQVARLSNLRWISVATGQPMRWAVPSGHDPALLVPSFRADERFRVYGTSVLAHPATEDAVVPSRVEGDEVVDAPPDALVAVEFSTATSLTVVNTPVALEPTAPVAVRDTSGLSSVDKVVATLEGDALDFNGDGKAVPYDATLVGTKLVITEPRAGDADSKADLAALGLEFSIVQTGPRTYEVELGGLKPLVDAAVALLPL